jgi:hypothetical protein
MLPFSQFGEAYLWENAGISENQLDIVQHEKATIRRVRLLRYLQQ